MFNTLVVANKFTCLRLFAQMFNSSSSFSIDLFKIALLGIKVHEDFKDTQVSTLDH